MVLHCMRLKVKFFVLLVLVLYDTNKMACYLISNIIDMSPTLDCCNSIYKADLVEPKGTDESFTEVIRFYFAV